MDFQTQQDQAHQNTLRLTVVFGLGLIALIAVVSGLFTVFASFGNGQADPVSAVLVAAPVTIVGVVGAALIKSAQVRRGGGAYVATSLGGRRVEAGTTDEAERRLLNVVDEMAIASGIQRPVAYVLDNESVINAFAAGWDTDDAVVAVTSGALAHLDRAELQGVVAHEMSHIRNRDTTINTRLIGWVFGIAAVAVAGRVLLMGSWMGPRRRGRDGNSAAVLLMAGLALVVVGSVGVFFARLIQAGVSRQREYLADATAVQYTRDPSGLAGALIKIGATGPFNRVNAAHVTEASHLFFASVGGSLSTHPPLEERIHRLDPTWDGTYPQLEQLERLGADANDRPLANRPRRPPPHGLGLFRPPPPRGRPHPWS